MERARAQELFKQADQLYMAGQYREALQVLGELNQAFPNQKNVLWPSALCMQKLGRLDEAARLCDALIQYFNDPRATELKERIVTQQAVMAPPPLPGDLMDGPVGLDAIDALLDRPATATRRDLPQAGPDYKKWGLIGAGVVVVLLLLLPLFAGHGGGDVGGGGGTASTTQVADGGAASAPAGFSASTPPTPEQLQEDPWLALTVVGIQLGLHDTTPWNVIRYFIFTSLLFGFIGNFLGIFVMLTVLKKMLSDELSDNLYDVLLYALLQTFVPIIGGIANLYFYSKRHGMACGELVVAWLLGGFFSGVLGWITSYMLGGFVRAMF